ncbi:transposase [Chloroflexota bacterium]
MSGRRSYQGVAFIGHNIVWIPRHRRRILNPGVLGYLSILSPKVLRSIPACGILAQNFQVDHFHPLMVIPPKCALSKAIGQVKQYTASRLREKWILERAGSMVSSYFYLHGWIG